MIYGLVLVVHVFVSLVLIGVILLQGGRGGLSETLSGGMAQSLFGGGVATVLTRLTTFCAGIFVVTCLSLAYLSTARGRSVVEQVPMINPSTFPGIPAPASLAPVSAEPVESHAQPASPPPRSADAPAPVQ